MSFRRFTAGKPIIIVRKDIEQLINYSDEHEPLRNQLIIDLPTKIGLRTTEMQALRWDNIDDESGLITIIDSKSKTTYPIPLPYQIAKKLTIYCEHEHISKKEGFILRRLSGASYSHLNKNERISAVTIWKTWHTVARRAGVNNPKEYTPRLGRHYFAADWHNRGGSLEVLRRILRHIDLTYTQIYLSRLVFFEDVQEEYKKIHGLPIEQSIELREECLNCVLVNVCKYREEFSRCEAASGCRFQKRPSSYVPEPAFMKPRRKYRHRKETYYFSTT